MPLILGILFIRYVLRTRIFRLGFSIRTDAELNASLLKIGVEGTMFVKHYGLSHGSEQASVS
jgi:hypothetical protein